MGERGRTFGVTCQSSRMGLGTTAAYVLQGHREEGLGQE